MAKILCVDFDGVIHSYRSGWQGADIVSDPPVAGAIEFLERASEVFEVHIYSSRSGQEGGLEAMQEWLWRQVTGEGYEPSATVIVPVWLLQLRWPTSKPAAFLTIDDRAYCFTGIFPPVEELAAFKTWMGK